MVKIQGISIETLNKILELKLSTTISMYKDLYDISITTLYTDTNLIINYSYSNAECEYYLLIDNGRDEIIISRRDFIKVIIE